MAREKTPDQLMEAETILRFDESGLDAYLWTASRKVMKDWVSFGFPVKEARKPGCWWCDVPIDRITYRPLKGKS